MKIFLKLIKMTVLVCCIFFFVHQFSGPVDSTRDFPYVSEKIEQRIDLDTMTLQDNMGIKRFLMLEPEQYEKILYYKSTDTMQADEIVLVQFKDKSQHILFKDTLQKHIQDQMRLFQGYAPAEEDKCKNAIIDIRANYALYVVSADAQKIDRAFQKALQ